jgi:hypothetical protein
MYRHAVTTRRYIPKHSKLHNRRRENLKSHIISWRFESWLCFRLQVNKTVLCWAPWPSYSKVNLSLIGSLMFFFKFFSFMVSVRYFPKTKLNPTWGPRWLIQWAVYRFRSLFTNSWIRCKSFSSNDRMIVNDWIGKNMEQWHILRYYSSICLKSLTKSTEWSVRLFDVRAENQTPLLAIVVHNGNHLTVMFDKMQVSPICIGNFRTNPPFL